MFSLPVQDQVDSALKHCIKLHVYNVILSPHIRPSLLQWKWVFLRGVQFNSILLSHCIWKAFGGSAL